MNRLRPKRNNLAEGLALGFTIGIMVMVIALFLTSCSPTTTGSATQSDEPTPVPANTIDPLFEKIGCQENVCIYRFTDPERFSRMCFLAIGQKTLNMDTWMFDLECDV